MTDPKEIDIPNALLPSDGRFCSGPSKVRKEAIAALADSKVVGTSHRKAPVKNTIAALRSGLSELFQLPGGYEVILGNGGATYFWDTATFCLVESQSSHASYGEFSSKFAQFAAKAPHIKEPLIATADAGTSCAPETRDDVDTYALIHNETSTGVLVDPTRPAPNGLVLVDGTSAAGGALFDVTQTDAYYFSPQKCFGSEAGMWLALMSPAALERAERLADSRFVPTTLNLAEHIANSRADTTYNTPSLITLLLTLDQVNWINNNGGLKWATDRCATSSKSIYDWADNRDFAYPYVSKPEERSTLTCTIDFDASISTADISAALRANDVVDVDGYRKLGRNQLRIATFPSIEPSDVEALLACIDYVVGQLS